MLQIPIKSQRKLGRASQDLAFNNQQVFLEHSFQKLVKPLGLKKKNVSKLCGFSEEEKVGGKDTSKTIIYYLQKDQEEVGAGLGGDDRYCFYYGQCFLLILDMYFLRLYSHFLFRILKSGTNKVHSATLPCSGSIRHAVLALSLSVCLWDDCQFLYRCVLPWVCDERFIFLLLVHSHQDFLSQGALSSCWT